MASFLEVAKRHASYDFDPGAIDIRLHAVWGMSIPGTGASVHVEWGADQPRDAEREAALEALFVEPWRARYSSFAPVKRLPWGTPNSLLRAGILEEFERGLTGIGVNGAAEFRAFPTGWMLIAHVLFHYLRAWAEEGEEIEILEIRERVGVLECKVAGSERVDRLAIWAKHQSYDRCQVTGD
ncbi:hypothetical protein CLV79_10923 [Limimaricola soesokkakensis]|uniref:Uncharacterized protein n=1 Tax=Limimaricola soesokkakensis TaxID=1343159 RepID=A0A1X6ZU96_9RHOB|nr:hypothetical protein [Limimaricola soesokkakensis]PSK84051.1 hypothetical protein CLV79_10923 [Limimaricola soesokkakensis]SLN59798.1 hypothetical protein LOS8367_02875 [Limimaricola soesokkakensis]